MARKKPDFLTRNRQRNRASEAVERGFQAWTAGQVPDFENLPNLPPHLFPRGDHSVALMIDPAVKDGLERLAAERGETLEEAIVIAMRLGFGLLQSK